MMAAVTAETGVKMLQDRTAEFTRFMAQLDTELVRNVETGEYVSAREFFMDAAMAQLDHLSRCESDEISLLDCMENVMDEWMDLRHYNPAHMDEQTQAILGRIAR